MSLFVDKQFENLTESIDWSNRQLSTPREERIAAIKQMVGIHYFEGGSNRKQPCPMLALAIAVHVRQLAARSPRAMFSTHDETMKSVAVNFELAVNQIAKEIDLTSTFQELVLEALVSPLGVLKVGLHTIGDLMGHPYGRPFVDVVTIDNYFIDMSAKREDTIQYEGNDYWMEFDALMESNMFPKKWKDGISSDEYEIVNEQGEERAESVAVNETAIEFKKRIWLRDVYLHQEDLFLTYAVKERRKLREVEWPEREVEPYYKLGFNRVPGNLLPLPPVSLWRDLDELGNALYRKLGCAADAQKTVLGFPGGNEDSILAFQGASDGDGIMYTGAEPKKLQAGGVDNNTLAFFLNCKDLTSYFAGNLDTLGGLAPMTQTVGQDKLLSEAAGAQIRDMAAKTLDVARDVFRALAWYDWNDPIGQRVLQRPIPGAGSSISVPWGPESRQGDFSVFDLDIDPHSAQDDSPGVKLQKLGMIVQNYILPFVPLIEAKGGDFDIQDLIKTVAKLADVPEIQDIVSWSDSERGTGNLQSTNSPAKANEQTGQRMRGVTDRGQSSILQRVMAGDKPQQSELEK